MIGGLLDCCNRPLDEGCAEELRIVQLTSDMPECQQQPIHLLTRVDSFDMTVTPRAISIGDQPRTAPITPRQQTFKDRLKLPLLRHYPVPPSCKPEDPEEYRRHQLLQTYQEFVLDLQKGMYLTQLTSNQDYSDIHCQILEDLQTLKLDQGSGCIIEFPLSGVSKVYRIVKNDDKWYSAGSLTGPTPMPPLPLSNAEHIVVVEFMRRKLAFVFKEILAAQNFLMCMELLIRRAQECRLEAAAAEGRGNGQGSGQPAASYMYSGYATRGESVGRSESTSLRDVSPARRTRAPASKWPSCICQPNGGGTGMITGSGAQFR